MKGLEFTADSYIQTAARHIMAGQQAILRSYEADLRSLTSQTAVHEARKAIRRLRTAFKLFEPYVGRRALKTHRQDLKQTMQYLALSRDIDVFLLNLSHFSAETARTPGEIATLGELHDYWTHRAQAARESLRQYLVAPEYSTAMTDFERFLYTPASSNPGWRVRHALPILLYERLAGVYTAGEGMDNATPARLHQLRIQLKDLRYALEFFSDVLGTVATETLLAPVKALLSTLGDLNDARVHREMLRLTSGHTLACTLVEAHISAETARLIAASQSLWPALNHAAWHTVLRDALAQFYPVPQMNPST